MRCSFFVHPYSRSLINQALTKGLESRVGGGNLWEDPETAFNFFPNEKAKLRQGPQVVPGGDDLQRSREFMVIGNVKKRKWEDRKPEPPRSSTGTASDHLGLRLTSLSWGWLGGGVQAGCPGRRGARALSAASI